MAINILDLEDLEKLLRRCWTLETCAPKFKDKWSETNATVGQCAVTALIVQDYFGGKIMRCPSATGSHYYNKINSQVIDLTYEQFLSGEVNYRSGEKRTRNSLLSNEDTKNRYMILRQNLQDILDEEKVKIAMQFYLLATKLKYKIRAGWDHKHWNISSERVESIAEHVYGTCILAISINSEFQLNMDMEKVLKMLTIHEIGEVLIGDITPFDKTTQEEKEQIEHRAMLEVLGDLVNRKELFDLLLEFDEHTSKEAKFAFLCDKMEADIQSKVYQDMGYHHSLDDQENNVVFKNSKVQKMIENGATTAFDIWHEWDKSIYDGEPVFQKTLAYIKKNNTNL